jgi:peptidoglycan hydrolase-like protein with peptidoglycan-binding domain
MPNFIKRSLVAGVTALMAFGPLTAGAMTTAELQAQLNALISQLAQIQAQQANTSGAVETADADCVFNRNLYAGINGSDVKCLQNYLVEENFLKVTPTGYFGSSTKNAVARWQAAHDISASGYFGEVSRRTYGALAANKPDVPTSEENAPTTRPTQPVYCAQVMRQCSDGSYVGYKPNSCEYYACPVVVTPSNPWIIVTYPRGGETFYPGSVAQISWNSANLPTGATVDIGLTDASGQKGDNSDIAKNIANSGLYRWYIPSNWANYNRRVIVSVHTAPGTQSTFGIAAGDIIWGATGISNNPTLSYITPTSVLAGQTVYVYGTNFDYATYVQFDGNYGAVVTPTITSPTTLWFTVPTTMSAGSHDIQLAQKAGNGVFSSTARLTVTSGTAASVTVVSPANYATLVVGERTTIGWYAKGDSTDSYQILVGNSMTNSERQLYDRVSDVALIPVWFGSSFSWNVPDLATDFARGTNYTRDQIKNSFYLIVKVVRDDRAGGGYVASSNKVWFTVNGGVSDAGTSPAPISASVSANSAFSNPTYTAGSTNVKLASFVVSAPTSSGIKISTINLDKDYSPAVDLQNLRIIASGSQFGNTKATISDHDQVMMFSTASPVVVPAGGSVVFDVYGDIKTSSENGTYQSVIDFGSWSAVGVNGAVVNTPGEVSGQMITVGSVAVVSRLTLSATTLGSASGRVGTSVDDLATITAYTNLNVMATLKSLSLNLSGDALQSIGAFSVSLIDPNTGTLFPGTSIQTCHVSGNACRVSFENFNAGLFAGSSKTMKVRVSSTGFGNASYGTNGLRVTVKNADVTWNDGVPNTTLTMGNTAYELLVANVSYQMGSTAAIIIRPVGQQTNAVTAGMNNQKIGQFNIYAPANQSMQVYSLTFDKDYDAGLRLQNMYITTSAGTTQFGGTRTTVNDSEATLTFSSPTPVTIPANTSIGFILYADVLSSSTAGTHASPVDITGWTATGSVSGSAIAFPGAFEGSDVSVTAAVSVNSTISFSLSSTMASRSSVVMGSTGNEVLRVRFTNDNAADVRITDLTINDLIGGSSIASSFQNFSLYNGSSQVAGPIAMSLGSGGGSVAFALSGSGVTIPRSGSIELSVRADVGTYAAGAISGSSHMFSLTSGNIRVSNGSAGSVNIFGSAYATPVIVYRTKISLSGTALGVLRGRAATAVDDVGVLNITVDPAYQAVLQSIYLTLSGSALTPLSSINVDLIDADTNQPVTGVSGMVATSICTVSGSSCTAVFGPNFTMNAGTTKMFKVRINSSVITSGSLDVYIRGTGDLKVSDGTTERISLDSTVVPFTISNLSY